MTRIVRSLSVFCESFSKCTFSRPLADVFWKGVRIDSNICF